MSALVLATLAYFLCISCVVALFVLLDARLTGFACLDKMVEPKAVIQTEGAKLFAATWRAVDTLSHSEIVATVAKWQAEGPPWATLMRGEHAHGT